MIEVARDRSNLRERIAVDTQRPPPSVRGMRAESYAARARA
jgi:hypothetical protein